MSNKHEAIVKILLEWHRESRRVLPWREKRDPYMVLVAEFFLQRTPTSRVAVILPKFIGEFPSLEKLASADPDKLKHAYRTLGLGKRMLWLVETAKVLCQKHDGKVPDKLEDLLSLPGIGEYTASAILCFGFGGDVPIVDANVVRVLTRIFGLPVTHRIGNSSLKELARKLVPKGKGVDYNEAILDFAAIVCKKNPLHQKCPLTDLCSYFQSIAKNKNPPEN
jgi:A/G-specific adenine glycosylase